MTADTNPADPVVTPPAAVTPAPDPQPLGNVDTAAIRERVVRRTGELRQRYGGS